jgi:hypothetical protein
MKNWVPNSRPYSDDIGLSANAAVLADGLEDIALQCSTCLYFDLDEDNSDGSGQCRRYPPVMSQLDGESRFPAVPNNCGCGEWHAAPISDD